MNLETLQALSNDELNELSATKVMGWKSEKSPTLSYDKYYNKDGPYIAQPDWNPTTDMNAAMELASQINGCLHLKEHGKQGEWEANFCVYPNSEAHAETAPRAITIASILAKED